MHLRIAVLVLSVRAYSQQMRNDDVSGHVSVVRKPPGFTGIGIFPFFGALMAGLAASTLLRQGTALDRIWALKPAAYAELAPHGKIIGILFLLLSAAVACAGIGWFQRRLWGWRLAVAIIATQVLGDVFNAMRGDILGGGIGVVLAAGLLLYILRPRIRAAFATDGA